MPRKPGFIAIALWLIAAPWALDAEPARKIDYARDIKPILSNTCFQCHGPDADERKGPDDGLRLDTPEGSLADLGGHAAVAPGHPEQSELVRRITSKDADQQMPPPKSGKKIKPHEIELLTEWIRQGGKYAGHWSYVKPAPVEPPAVKNAAWPRGVIDRFILARLEKEGLQPSPEADRHALIRRVSLDLTGLPPKPEEADAFAASTDPQAYEKLVDRLLEQKTYGEHWAHMWLDLARYADSAGYADDPPRTIWPYRDYVIQSLNANKPFDQFTLEQIAGDLLPKPTDEQLIATAFHRNTLTNNEGGTNDEEFRNVAVVDRVNTTLAVWMGTTIACAQCHTHKYDPITQEEYFRVFALFNNSEDADRADESPLLSIYGEDQKLQRNAWQQELAALEQKLRTPTPEIAAAEQRWQQAFPLNLAWQPLKPAGVKSSSGAATTISDQGDLHVAAGAKNDTYTIDLAPSPGIIRALQLESLPDETLPGKGPGHAEGNFILTRASAAFVPPASQSLSGRFVRIELPGKARMLSLAEVQVFRGSENAARGGTATQSSTDYDGPPQLAIDGNTDGRYREAHSTTHTAASDDPWWEVDLKSEQPLDSIVVWNRADNVEERLANFKVLVLNEKRQPVWEQGGIAAPKPSVQLSLSGQKNIELAAAAADYSQPGFEADQVLNNKDPGQKGWAVGGQVGQPHALTLVFKTPLETTPGARLAVTLEHAAKLPNQTLAHFRLSSTADERALEFARTPAAVVQALRAPAAQRTPAQSELITKHYLALAPELAAARQRMAEITKLLAEVKPSTVPVMREMAKGRVTKIQHRGNYLDLGKEVTPGVPAALTPAIKDMPGDRLALARWLVDENNPLTSRVIANRCWEQIFGIGIVASSEDFGSQGDQPFHPELLDWLATDLVRSRWDLKAFIKQLVTSAAYRQTTRMTPELAERDPDNRLLARGPRFRMPAEVVRDQALFVSGLLSLKMHGPPVKPPQPSSGLSAAFGGGIDWQTSAGEDRFRRALYTTWRRSSPYPSMATFDAPNREVCTVRRIRTNTPLQALVTLNDPVYVEAAQALARRMLAEGGSTPADRARFGFRLCLTRPPREAELASLLKLYEHNLARFQKSPAEAQRLATEPIGPAPAGANIAELAAWTVLGNVLLNLDETVMKR